MSTAEGTAIDASRSDRSARRAWPLSAVSTPTALKVAMVVCVAAVTGFGIVGTRTALDRRAAAADVVAHGAPLLVDAQELYIALAGADAAASTIFLEAGDEAPARRDRYLADLGRAGRRLAAIAAAELPPRATAAAATVAEQLPVYALQVEAARTNSRLGHPVGAASLRRASALMRDEILPAATGIYEDAALALDERYAGGTAPTGPRAVVLCAGVALVVLVLVQLYVTRRSRRWLNVGLVVAVALVVGTAAATLIVVQGQADALARSRDRGADPVTRLSTARILTLRSLSDDNLELIERGTEAEYREDFALSIARLGLGDARGVLDGVTAPTAATRRTMAVLDARFDAYLAAHAQVQELSAAGDWPAAVQVAVTEEADAVRALDRMLTDLIERFAATLDGEAERARGRSRALPVATAVAAVAAAIAVVIGLRPRLKEYR